jgi:hypothetical protein
MVSMTRSHTFWAAGALALVLALPAAHAASPSNDRTVAQAFVQDLSSGHYTQAETHLRPQLRKLATPAKLHKLWQLLVHKFGPYQKIDGSDSVTVQGHPTVIVHMAFKRLTVGLEVAFNKAHQIGGLHVVPVQPAP